MRSSSSDDQQSKQASQRLAWLPPTGEARIGRPETSGSQRGAPPPGATLPLKPFRFGNLCNPLHAVAVSNATNIYGRGEGTTDVQDRREAGDVNACGRGRVARLGSMREPLVRHWDECCKFNLACMDGTNLLHLRPLVRHSCVHAMITAARKPCFVR